MPGIWARVALSIFYDDNTYTRGTSTKATRMHQMSCFWSWFFFNLARCCQKRMLSREYDVTMPPRGHKLPLAVFDTHMRWGLFSKSSLIFLAASFCFIDQRPVHRTQVPLINNSIFSPSTWAVHRRCAFCSILLQCLQLYVSRRLRCLSWSHTSAEGQCCGSDATGKVLGDLIVVCGGRKVNSKRSKILHVVYFIDPHPGGSHIHTQTDAHSVKHTHTHI